MKILLILVSVLFSFGVFAEVQKVPEKHVDVKQVEARKTYFDDAKIDFSQILDEHTATVQKAKDCISKAEDLAALKVCKKEFNKGEKSIRKEQRQKFIKKIKNKEIKNLENNPPKM